MKRIISDKEGYLINNINEADVIVVKSNSGYIEEEIEKLGGKFLENLLKSTHYLIINKINSSKAISALKNNIKLF